MLTAPATSDAAVLADEILDPLKVGAIGQPVQQFAIFGVKLRRRDHQRDSGSGRCGKCVQRHGGRKRQLRQAFLQRSVPDERDLHAARIGSAVPAPDPRASSVRLVAWLPVKTSSSGRN